MISLCGSVPNGFFEAIGIGFIVILGVLFYTHYKVYTSKYYNEEYVYFSAGKKVLLYLLFLAINICAVPLLIIVSLYVYTRISN